MDFSFLLTPQEDGSPRVAQLYNALRQAIQNGTLEAGQRLPATRRIATELGIARNTVIHAYEQLTAEGYLLAAPTGARVASLKQTDQAFFAPRQDTQNKFNMPMGYRFSLLEDCSVGDTQDLLAFTPGLPDLFAFPMKKWQTCLDYAWQRAKPNHLHYAPAGGQKVLREAIARHVRVTRGVKCEPNQVIITIAAQGALDVCARILGDVGDTAWIENPGYSGARTALLMAGLKLHPIAVDEEGLAPTEEDWQNTPPRLIYTTPSHQYPLGCVMSPERRRALIERCRDQGVWIIEDDYDSEFRHSSQPVAAMQGLIEDTPVIYVGTFSKTMLPALRIGYLIVPAAQAAAIERAVTEIAHPGHSIEQIALAHFIDEGFFAAHLRKMRKRYLARQAELRHELHTQLGDILTVYGSDAGMHLTALLPEAWPDTEIARLAEEQGVIVYPLSAHVLPHTTPIQNNGLVMGYGLVEEKMIPELVKRLAQIIRNYSSQP